MNRMMAAFILIASVGAGGFVWYKSRSPKQHLIPVKAIAAPYAIHDFKEPVIFEQVDDLTKKRLLDATLQTCVKKYSGENCVYYLLVCGSHCQKLLNPQTFQRAREDFWKIASRYGISPRAPASKVGPHGKIQVSN